MGRCYHLSKTVTEDLANEIIKELTERGDVKHARISADGRYLHVDTIDGEFSVVLYSAVNICSRIANCELSFVKFDYTAYRQDIYGKSIKKGRLNYAADYIKNRRNDVWNV